MNQFIQFIQQFMLSPTFRNILALLVLGTLSISLFRYGTRRLRAGPTSNPLVGCVCWFIGAVLLAGFTVLLIVAVHDLQSAP